MKGFTEIKLYDGPTMPSDIEKNENQLYDGHHNQQLVPSSKLLSSSKQQTGWRRFGGILLSLSSCVTLSLMALIVKVLKNYHSFTLSFWRYAGTTLPSLIIIIWCVLWKKEAILKPLWPLSSKEKDTNLQERRTNVTGILVRGIIGVTVTILRFSALKYISLGDVSTITQSYTIFVFLFAYLFLHEACNAVSLICAIMGMIGVAILSRPPLLTGEQEFSDDTLTGLGLACGAMFCSSFSIVITRKLRQINFAILIFGFGIVGLCVSGGLALSFGVFKFPENLTDTLLTLLICSLSFISQILSTFAIKYEEAGVISIVKVSYVLFAFIWQILLLHEYPDLISYVGASIILTGLFLTAIRKWINTLPEADERKKKLAFFLI